MILEGISERALRWKSLARISKSPSVLALPSNFSNNDQSLETLRSLGGHFLGKDVPLPESHLFCLEIFEGDGLILLIPFMIAHPLQQRGESLTLQLVSRNTFFMKDELWTFIFQGKCVFVGNTFESTGVLALVGVAQALEET